MAQVFQKTNDLQASYDRSRVLALVGFGGGALCIILAILLPFFPLFFVGAAGILLGGAMQKSANIYKVGLEGEGAAARIISSLPADYCCFRNLKVSYQGKPSEMDLVVTGPNGVFIVETKNYKGTICGDLQGHDWVQNKVGRGGTPYSKTFHSPVKQVGTHVYRLANNLRSKGFSVYVKSAVFFSNPESYLQLTGQNDKIPVFGPNDIPDLLSYLTDGAPELSREELQRLNSYLCSL